MFVQFNREQKFRFCIIVYLIGVIICEPLFIIFDDCRILSHSLVSWNVC